METTERYDELKLETQLGLIGKPVIIGVYLKPTENDHSEPVVCVLTGMLEGILEKESSVEVTTGRNGSIHWDPDRYYALFTWLDETATA